MKLCGGLLLLLLCLVSGADAFTQVFLFQLDIESSVQSRVTQFLNGYQTSVSDSSISELSFTTDCSVNGSHWKCSCVSGNTWSSNTCETYQCCQQQPFCLQTLNSSAALCLSSDRVSISGVTSFTYQYNTLSTSQEAEIQTTLLRSFSALKYFSSLVISGYSPGSVMVSYTVQLLGPVTSSNLSSLNANFSKSQLTTQGLINITVPSSQPVDVGSDVNVTCTSKESLGSVTWTLTDASNSSTVITDGTEASLSSSSLVDTVTLVQMSGSWKGTFTCSYQKQSVYYTASAVLDVALLPTIQSMSDPQFPDCRTAGPSSSVSVTVSCRIPQSSENYTVTWSGATPSSQGPALTGSFLTYTAQTLVSCSSTMVMVYCTFTNTRSLHKANASNPVQIPVINAGSSVCPADSVWPITKAGFTAVQFCAGNAVGQNSRLCSAQGWQPALMYCVNNDLVNIQNFVQEIDKGLGFIKDNATSIFSSLKQSTSVTSFSAFANIDTSVKILQTISNVSVRQSNTWDDSIMPDFVSSASNLFNNTASWQNPANPNNSSLPVTYLETIESMMMSTKFSSGLLHMEENVAFQLCNDCTTFGVKVNVSGGNSTAVNVFGFRNLAALLPNTVDNSSMISNATILSITRSGNPNSTENDQTYTMSFDFSNQRLPNHEMYCVFWDTSVNQWSTSGCTWGGASNPKQCVCSHNSAFTILMSGKAETIPYADEITYAGLGISTVSLLLCLLVEYLVWDSVVKSNISSFRHVALVNISLCLLLAHGGVLASMNPQNIPNFCLFLTVEKHFFFLAVFFWMLSLSFLLLHQIIFVFDRLRKKMFLGLSFTVGYICPLLDVVLTVIYFGNGAAHSYYSTDTCWLIYDGVLKGSIFSFVLPVGIIVFINLFTLIVVITKIVTPSMSEAKAKDEKDVARSVIKTIVFLCPILGVTWILGLFVTILDLTTKPWAQIVNYSFTVLNSLQGFFIFLTNCFGEKKIRDALLKRFTAKKSENSKSERSSTSSSVKKQ